MGMKSIVSFVSVLLLSCLVDNISVRAVAIERPVVTAYSNIATISKRQITDTEPKELVSVKRSTLGLSTADPTLQTEDAWYWGVDANNPNAAVSYAPDDPSTQRVIGMESFGDWVKGVKCSDEQVTIQFKSSDTYEKTKDAWQWLDEDNRRNFVMIVEHPDCGPQRLPYVVEEVDYDPSTNSATMTAKRERWSAACPTYKLKLDTEGLVPAGGNLGKREQTTIDMTQSFDQTLFSQPFGSVNVELNCKGCNLKGSSFHLILCNI
jgi:hypothetical protein